MKSSEYDWSLILHKIKVATKIKDIDIAVEFDCDVSLIRRYRFNGVCPKFDLGNWLRIEYEKAYGEPMPKKR